MRPQADWRPGIELAGLFDFFLSESDRGDVAQGTVGADVVVLPTPILEHYPGLGQSPELFSIQAFFAQAGIEALMLSSGRTPSEHVAFGSCLSRSARFYMAILPRASRIDVDQPPFSPLRSGPNAASKPSRQKQIPSSKKDLGKADWESTLSCHENRAKISRFQ